MSQLGTLTCLSLLVVCHPFAAAGEHLVFRSSKSRAQVVELFTSQGCSSCPNAERFLGSLVDKPTLWEKYVPIAYHVDYWDNLGWKDPFAKQEFTQRQYAHRKADNIGSVYTPCFVVNGSEWRGYFQGDQLPKTEETAGVFSIQLQGNKLTADFENATGNHALNIALLGSGISTKVTRGENKNRILPQEFVALWQETGLKDWQAELPAFSSLPSAERYAVVAWVTLEEDLRPVQAVGGWIPSDLANPRFSEVYP